MEMGHLFWEVRQQPLLKHLVLYATRAAASTGQDAATWGRSNVDSLVVRLEFDLLLSAWSIP